MENVFKGSEMFISIQGEGPYIGVPTLFVRLYGCNLRCPWCDSQYSYKDEPQIINFEDIINQLKGNKGVFNICFTGGEPLLQIHTLKYFLGEWEDYLYGQNISIEIETNGTIDPHILSEYINDELIHLRISPKLPSTMYPNNNTDNMLFNKDMVKTLFDLTSYNTIFKFVVDMNNMEQNFKDIEQYILKLEEINNNEPHYFPIYIMKQGTTKNQQLHGNTEILINEIIKRGYIYSPRLHILIWDDKRGV